LSLRMLYCEITENGLKKRLDQDGYSTRINFKLNRDAALTEWRSLIAS